MVGIYFALAALTLLGHAAIWVGVVNRVHSTAARRMMVKAISLLGYILLPTVPLIAAVLWLQSGESLGTWVGEAASNFAVWLYAAPCMAVAVLTIALWIQRRWLSPLPDAVRENHTTVIDVASLLAHPPLHGLRARVLWHFPYNQVLQLAVQEKVCVLDRLPPALEGLSIAHLSDLHITGRIGIDYFREVARQTRLLKPDLIAVTGDIIDELKYIDWIPEIFSQLSAPLGKFFVLGNHDLFTRDPNRVRQSLAGAGLIDVGGRCRTVGFDGADLVIAGNELPWFAPPADPLQLPPRDAYPLQLRIALSHSPDQFAWARGHDFDLMLAGHTHGGQIAPPLIGPILAPSWHGVKYAAGTFFKPPTLMHVSRGISAELPIRLNCPPELTKLVLRRPVG